MTDKRRSVVRRLAGRARRTVRDLRGQQQSRGITPGSDLDLVVSSPLFDVEWYNLQTGVERTREDAARHYLAMAPGAKPNPHPLFDPQYYVHRMPPRVVEEVGDTDPFVFYLRRGAFRRPTSPLFDTAEYLKANAEARTFAGGPLAHYDQVGAVAGLRANDWMPVGEDGRFPDLRAWLRDRVQEWSVRDRALGRPWRKSFDEEAARRFRAEWAAVPAPDGAGAPVVSVVLDAGLDGELLTGTLESLVAQHVDWELVVIDRGGIDDLDARVAEKVSERSTRTVRCDDDTLPDAFAQALESSSGRFVAFVRSGDRWEPDRLQLLTAVAEARGARTVVDGLVRGMGDGTARFAVNRQPEARLAAHHSVDAARALVERRLLQEIGGIDPTMRGNWLGELMMRAARAAPFEHVPVIGVRRAGGSKLKGHTLPPGMRPPVDHTRVDAWQNVAVNRHAVDWAFLESRPPRAGVVSVIIPTYHDSTLTWDAVESVAASDGIGDLSVECIVWDNGSNPTVSATLDALAHRFPGVTVLHSPVNHGFALGNNLALAHASGETVVFLNNDTTVPQDWLVPVARTLADPHVLAVQPLLLYPSGSVQSAGVVFPSTGGLPHAFLQGFPAEDAAGIETLDFAALTGAALAMRYDDAVALRGFDPIFTNGMEDVDLCHRLSQLRPGVMRVVPEEPVVHHESRTPGRYAKYMANRRLYLERWTGVLEPRDDVDKWAARGFRVVDHEVTQTAPWQERRLLLPNPVLVRQAKLEVHESPRALRWAIKNPAPAGPNGERWGDTHFARAIADALRGLGQQVVIDHRAEFERVTSRHDDVSLVLRGVAPFKPSPEHVSIGWVISHPEMLGRSEAAAYDRLVAASVTWAKRMSGAWGIRIDPLLQATDPRMFHPDRAVPDTGHPVLFVGSSRHVFRPIVKDAVDAGLPVSIYGDAWRKFVHKRYVKADFLPNADLGAAYRSAGVVLNDHWEDMREDGFLSNRLFDAVASGARVITDQVGGLREVFGDTVQVYSSPEDLTRLSSLPDPSVVFGTDDVLREAAAVVHRDHSFHARAEQLVAIAMEERARLGFVS